MSHFLSPITSDRRLSELILYLKNMYIMSIKDILDCRNLAITQTVMYDTNEHSNYQSNNHTY
jgi:hypothetical protein